MICSQGSREETDGDRKEHAMKLQDILKKQEDEGKEKHVPGINVIECSSCGELTVTVQVDKEVMHPYTQEHYIRLINLFGRTKEGKTVLVACFNLEGQNSLPRVKISVKRGAYSELLAVIYCTLHGVWENSLEVKL